ncbi:MAG TPA: carbon-nitrogen hydrolase family protein [Burkholderiaceae bacterium]|nr:carbon-nitrogen hydrolase family protein [Burkholderiaceae bacterium]
MNQVVRVAGVQMVSTTRVDANLRTAATLIAQAAAGGARLIALPEYFCLMGQSDTDKVALREADGQGPIQDFLANQARQHRVCLVGGTVPLVAPENDRVLNSLLVYGPSGERVARYDKIHLFRFNKGKESYDEARTIAPGNKVASFKLATEEGARLLVGLSICYDLRFPELYRALPRPDLIVVPSAFTATTGRAHWEVLLRARAIENLAYVLAPAQGGRHENGRSTYGHTMLIDPWGAIVANRADGEGVVFGDIDPQLIADSRASLPALEHRVLT